jgi:hypothetical protein
MDCPFWPYCKPIVTRDLSKVKSSKIVHILIFLGIVLLLTILEKTQFIKYPIIGVGIQGVRLFAEIIGDRILGLSLFKWGK